MIRTVAAEIAMGSEASVAPGRGGLTVWARRAWRGQSDDPVWVRPALIALLGGTALVYFWSLDVNGYGNTYYAAAAYSASESWWAGFFGSVDPAGFISVDKPPLSVWVSGVSVRIFGLSTWSVLVPHVLAGVATVGVLYRTVRRWHGYSAGLLAGLALATTPVAVVMFRYNNPDAILTLLLTGALALGYSAARTGRLPTLVLAFGLVGLAFLTKTTQSLLVLPALGITYLAAAPIELRRRVLHLAAAAAVMVAVAGWWVAAVELTPAENRPYVGGTTSNSFMEYVLGYNGLDRVTSHGPGGGGNDPFGGGSGWGRLFNDQVGGQVSWHIPLALAGLALGWRGTRRRARTDHTRTGWLMWGTVFAVHFALFSLMNGVFHPYYTLTMAPAIAAMAGAGVVVMWRAYQSPSAAGWLLPVSIAASAAWAGVLLTRTPDFAPGLGTAVVVVGLGAGGVMALLRVARQTSRRSALGAAAVGLAVLVAGPAAYAADTLNSSFAGGDPKAGPEVDVDAGPLAAGRALPGRQDRAPDDRLLPPPDGYVGLPSVPPALPGDDGPPPSDDGVLPGRPPSAGPNGGGGPALQEQLVAYLKANRGEETWLVAVETAHVSGPLILETGEAVMTMGGFSGGDPAPTGEELADHVASGELRFVLLTEGRNISLGGRAAPQWEQWVPEHCSVVEPGEYGGVTGAAALYDCAAGR